MKPNRGQFPKGRSGNPGGRPAGSRPPQSSAFDIIVEKKLTVTRHGVTREITVEERLRQQTFRDALAGKRMAQQEVLKWIVKRDAWLVKHAPSSSPPAIKRHISPDPDNVDAALLLLGIATHNPARAEFCQNRAQLLLEPRIVQQALHRRRRRRRLTESDLERIRRCTRDPGDLRRPKGIE
jgi:hypothetical protein